MLRKIALSALMLVSLVVMLPLVNSTAHNIKYEAAQNQRRGRRHSRAWWRRHRALMRRRRAAHLRRRALVHARQEPNLAETSDNHAVIPSAVSLPPGLVRDAKGETALSLPNGWLPTAAAAKGETKFRVMDVNGASAGQAALSVVAAAAPQPDRVSQRERSRILAGVSYSDLRRTVIDKMITAGGWVINDLEREMGGRKVFVVVAQTPAASDGHESEKIWNFYFTEVDGRIYSLSTSAARQTSGRLASDAEKFITSLPSMARGTSRSSIR